LSGIAKPKHAGGGDHDGRGLSAPPPADESDPNVIALKQRFAKINRSADRRAWWRRLPDRMLVFAWVFAIASWAALAFVLMTPWTAGVTARHLAAAMGCDAARAVGLAPARRGEPGYWPWLDRDHDGVACKRKSGHGRRARHDGH
jgi:Excalibur calcium-binding domain